jgi:hypothetical protein
MKKESLAMDIDQALKDIGKKTKPLTEIYAYIPDGRGGLIPISKASKKRAARHG